MTRLTPPAAIKDIARTLEQAGHEAWCVGGAVRDVLLGFATQDWDLATSARPEEVQKLFKRTVPVGIQFGTVGVIDKQGLMHEVTTFRHDVETDGRHAVVKFGASLEEDLARRDFTLNAIAVHAETLEVRDPFDGRGDLSRRVIRCVGTASERMREDRLRALRALRFAGRFDFAIEDATWLAIVESAPHLGRLSMERVKQELQKVMEQVAQPASTLERYREAGIFASLVPLLADAPRERFAAVNFLARPGLARRPERLVIRLASLFAEPGVTPSRALEQTLKTLKFSNVESRAALTLAEGAGLVGGGLPVNATDVELRRLIARVGRVMVPALARVLWARARANAEGSHADPSLRLDTGAATALYRRALRSAFNDPLTVGDLVIDGEDLQHAGVGAGKAMGAMLKHLLEFVLVDPTRNTRDALLAEVRARAGAQL